MKIHVYILAANVNWDIGAASMLFYALSLKPSKDNFWTSYPQPLPSDYEPSGNDMPSVQLMTIVAIMSTGPVGISDMANYTNKTLIMRTCRDDGRLLQPNMPMIPINDQFIYKAFKKETINVWNTQSNPKNSPEYVNQIILAVDMATNYSLTYNSFNVKGIVSNINDYIIMDWYEYRNCKNGTNAIENKCVTYVPNQNSMNDKIYDLVKQPIIPPSLHSLQLITMIKGSLNSNDIIFIGELNKYVYNSQHRFSDLNINGNTLSVNIKGSFNETVELTVLIPTQTNKDWIIMKYNVIIPQTGYINFVI